MVRSPEFHKLLLSTHVRTTLRIVVMAMLLALIPCAADAAVVVLKNGDRITGLIVKMQDKKLEIDPEYSSTNITIDWEDVQSITSERPMSIQHYGNVEMPENVGQRVRDRIILNSLEEGGPIRLEGVRSINLAEHDYYGYISAGGNQTSGNTQTQALNLSGSLTYNTENHRFILDGKYNRAQADHKDTANNGSANVKYNYFLTRHLFTNAANLVETDQFQDLSLRNTTSLGLGYDILSSNQQLLSVAAGPAAVYQDYTTTPATITPSATWGLRAEFRFRGDDVILFHKHQGFKDLGHGSGTRVNADQGIRVKISDNWRVNFEYDLRYNSLPVANKKTTDANIIFGFSYDIKP
jgi:putative salt-induced outer membrane protein YdiY